MPDQDAPEKTPFRIYQGKGAPTVPPPAIPPAPPWRDFQGVPDPEYTAPQIVEGSRDYKRAISYQVDDNDADASKGKTPESDKVNAALYLRRPLLVTGRPGSGKSTLAYSVACELGLGEVLYWPISSRTTLQQGLYRYDAIARMQERDTPGYRDDIGRYIELGPLGTALLPTDRPRVLLIDEIDKSDIDLPNDLLNIFEEGWFEIPELARIEPEEEEHAGESESEERGDGAESVPKDTEFRVRVRGRRTRVRIRNGRVTCKQFPVIFMTSNEERDFPPAFLRRCLSLKIGQPGPNKLQRIVDTFFGEDALTETERAELITKFCEQRGDDKLATDQLLNAVFLTLRSGSPFGDVEALREAIFEPIVRRG